MLTPVPFLILINNVRISDNAAHALTALAALDEPGIKDTTLDGLAADTVAGVTINPTQPSFAIPACFLGFSHECQENRADPF